MRRFTCGMIAAAAFYVGMIDLRAGDVDFLVAFGLLSLAVLEGLE